MKVIRKNRKFKVGITKTTMTHIGDLKLANDEVLTVKAGKNKEYDITRKNWGFYSTPSINKRLLTYGFESAITYNTKRARYFMQIVEKNKKKEFKKYLKSQGMILITWLTKQKLDKIKKFI